MDLETLIIIIQRGSNRACYVYRIARDSDSSDEEDCIFVSNKKDRNKKRRSKSSSAEKRRRNRTSSSPLPSTSNGLSQITNDVKNNGCQEEDTDVDTDCYE